MNMVLIQNMFPKYLLNCTNIVEANNHERLWFHGLISTPHNQSSIKFKKNQIQLDFDSVYASP